MTLQNASQDTVRFLVLGNSHSNDVFFQLASVFKAQGFEKNYTIGFLYFSGCSVARHLTHVNEDAAVYDYYRSEGDWYTCRKKVTMKDALMDQEWDIIFLQAGKGDLDDTLNKKGRRELEAYVDRYVPTKHVFGWHTSWPNPTSDEIWSDNWYRKPPANYKNSLIERYNFDPVYQFSVYTETVKNNILPDPKYHYAICTGKAVTYALWVKGLSEFDLYRDYTHLSDFGRVLVAYTFYAQFTGKPLKEIKLDLVPQNHRKPQYQPEGDLILTPDLKAIILECANAALADPWTVPTKE